MYALNISAVTCAAVLIVFTVKAFCAFEYKYKTVGPSLMSLLGFLLASGRRTSSQFTQVRRLARQVNIT